MISLKEITQKIDGQLKGDPNLQIECINSLEKATEKEITFSVKEAIDTQLINAAALIVKKGSGIEYPNLIYVDEPYRAFAQLLSFFFPEQRFNDTVDSNAIIASDVKLGENTSVGPFTYIGDGTHIDENCEIHANVVIYPGVRIGKNCLIYSGVIIREDVIIGDHVIIQPGAVIGADGFGFTRLSNGTPIKIPQKGKVVIGNHCEIGANSCIDRSTIEETKLEDYVKVDNLVQIGHNVKIGKGTAISALTGISGSAEIGENVIMGGQVGIADHAKITDGVMVAAKSGVHGIIRKKSIIAGYPHMEISNWRKSQVILKNIEKYIGRIKELEKKIKQMEDKVK